MYDRPIVINSSNVMKLLLGAHLVSFWSARSSYLVLICYFILQFKIPSFISFALKTEAFERALNAENILDVIKVLDDYKDCDGTVQNCYEMILKWVIYKPFWHNN
jgi:hypothetical protein